MLSPVGLNNGGGRVPDVDVLQRMGRPARALSIAYPAASKAWKARFLPMLYQAFTVTAEIFVYLEDYDAAFEMLDAVMPQLLECEDAHLSGMAFSCLADGQIGLAGTNTSSTWREQCLNKALGYLDRALFGKKFLPRHDGTRY